MCNINDVKVHVMAQGVEREWMGSVIMMSKFMYHVQNGVEKVKERERDYGLRRGSE